MSNHLRGLDPLLWRGIHLLHQTKIVGNLNLGQCNFELSIGFRFYKFFFSFASFCLKIIMTYFFFQGILVLLYLNFDLCNLRFEFNFPMLNFLFSILVFPFNLFSMNFDSYLGLRKMSPKAPQFSIGMYPFINNCF